MLTPCFKGNSLRKNSNVDVAFMIDATASMGANIKAAKNSITTIVTDVKKAFRNNTVRMAFVAYRDYSEGSGRIEMLDFTEDVDSFSTALGAVVARNGGDYPEDVLGAINATLSLNWKAANKLFFQLGTLK